MSELELYKRVIIKLGFFRLNKIENEYKKDLSPFFSRAGAMDLGFHKEITDDDYWKSQKENNKFEIWSLKNSNSNSDFIIFGYDKKKRIVYFESVITNSLIKRLSNPSVKVSKNHREIYHDMSKDNFYDKFIYIFRDIKIEFLTYFIKFQTKSDMFL